MHWLTIFCLLKRILVRNAIVTRVLKILSHLVHKPFIFTCVCQCFHALDSFPQLCRKLCLIGMRLFYLSSSGVFKTYIGQMLVPWIKVVPLAQVVVYVVGVRHFQVERFLWFFPLLAEFPKTFFGEGKLLRYLWVYCKVGTELIIRVCVKLTKGFESSMIDSKQIALLVL